MARKLDVQKEINQISGLSDLVEVYGEIASIRMKKIRQFVLKNREYLDSINDIFQDALRAYSIKMARLVRQGKIKDSSDEVTFLAHNGKIVCVLISANTGFYGEIVQETYRKFIEETKGRDVELTVIGRLGRQLLIQSNPNISYTYFDMPDFGVDQENLSEIIRHLVQYEEIRVYYGKYQSVVNQVPSKFQISAETNFAQEKKDTYVEYIFEPKVEDILMFFEKEIFASLFDQSVRESQLAKFASRILAMDRASQNINQRMSRLKILKSKSIHDENSKKQLNSLSSLIYVDMI